METKRTASEEGLTKVFSRTDARFWKDRLFKRTTDEWQVRIGYAWRQERFPLKTANAEEAAGKARDIYLSLVASGWEATLIKYKPWTAEPRPERKAVVTVGDFLAAVKAVVPFKPTTLLTYERKFRKLVADVVGIKGTKKQKHDYFHKKSNAWRAKVDATPLSAITPERVGEWRVRYMASAGRSPTAQNSARVSAASIIRNSKTLFAPKHLRLLSLDLPSPLPFDGIEVGKLPRNRYRSKVNGPLLVKLAHDELRTANPEVYKIFLLAFGAGLRRGEIDHLTWKAIDWDKGTIALEVTEHGDLKTEGSADVIDISRDVADYFKAEYAKSKSEFVVSSAVPTGQPKHWNHYRCDHHFRELIEWLHSHGVEARNPIHTLRKEFGSLINQQFGIYAASSALRHSNISITRDYYVDKKERIALDLTKLAAEAAE